MNRFIKFLKNNIKIIIFYIFLIVLMMWEFPYYIDAPGGIQDVNNRITIDNGYNSKGSFNLAYVSEYKGSVPVLFLSLFNKDWKVYKKKDVLMPNESDSEYEYRDRLFLEEACSNAIYIGFSKANKKVNITDEKVYVSVVFEESDTNLDITDQILEVEGISIHSKEEIDEIVSNHNVGDTISIKVLKDNKEINRSARIIEYENKKVIGISVIKVRSIETDPNIDINYQKSESGPSGGLMLALAIYNSLVSEDITNGLTIVGTGTINEYGEVGSIGGVDYKLKSAVKNKADIFIVPNGENYEEAIKIKKDKGYNIDIVGVSTFDDALDYLKNRE